MCFKKNKRGKVLVLIDWENLSKSVITTFRITERYSELQELNKVIEKIADEVGDIYKVKVFCPLHQASLWGKDFYKLGFFIEFCPPSDDKKGEEEDTTDKILMAYGRKDLEGVRGLTHFCLGSGDQDFIPLLREAKWMGKKTIIIAGSLKSLAKEVIPYADKIYFLFEN
ncbi:MAG: hypothetical protein COX34_01255 [Candidatus Nealsonbacteria bacterium CG23_combo_of_CG06-09_8_20_14_all_36_12]|uniref:NYN domain-containing protein n=2 Tax=Candidatus Nealsoniibacteriota TaxID=1817911 RepID=A0A2H0TKY4_9BACT|nr:MAG: hypothetical protein COX34_01255 [Candidatus Nealsonbacteria bacterium CG23_combo_of_CG06-09_8_20_14_all_36_12]PIR72822.1 MAG: hypothetical protein COV26_01835 [Candidatus Nealsonbacteria bacterium CG10_big_fil_rev_8_21_14_0_10_36_23]